MRGSARHEVRERRRHTVRRVRRLRTAFSRSSRVSMNCTCSFVAPPVPTTAFLISAGGNSWIVEPRLLAGEQDHAARVAEHDGRAHVLGVEDVFDRERDRAGAARSARVTPSWISRSRARKRIARPRADDAALDERRRTPARRRSRRRSPVTAVPGIDAENDHVAPRRVRVTSFASSARRCRSSPRPSARRRAPRAPRAA